MSVQHRISAGAIVMHEGLVLMVRHQRDGVYDFWVCPGGGVQGAETLEAAAAREVREETGLTVRIGRLAYIEEFHNPEARFVKFWFLGEFVGGHFDSSHPDTVGEHITEVAWRRPEDIARGTVFPPFMQDRFWTDRPLGFPMPIRIALREMRVW